jgi:hypothetical protein
VSLPPRKIPDCHVSTVECRPVAKYWLCKQRPLLGNGRKRQHRNCFLVDPLRGYITRPTELSSSQWSGAELSQQSWDGSEKSWRLVWDSRQPGSGVSSLVSEWVIWLLRFSCCELLLLEAGSWGMGTVWEKGNVRRWTPLPESWWRHCRLRRLKYVL